MGRVWPRSVSGTRQVQRRSPWPPPFPPPPPPGLLSPLFGSFIGTMAESDSSRACISGLWLAAFPDRSAAEAVDTREVSRFSCISFPDVRGVSDYAGPAASSRIALDGSVAFPRTDTVGTRNEIYEAQYPAHQCPCLCFECVLAAMPARLGVKMESLLPSRGALSSPTICRLIPALLSPRTENTGRERSPGAIASGSAVGAGIFFAPAEACSNHVVSSSAPSFQGGTTRRSRTLKSPRFPYRNWNRKHCFGAQLPSLWAANPILGRRLRPDCPLFSLSVQSET